MDSLPGVKVTEAAVVIKAGGEGEVAVDGEEANEIMYEAWAIQLISRPVSDRCTMITFIPRHFFINQYLCLPLPVHTSPCRSHHSGSEMS